MGVRVFDVCACLAALRPEHAADPELDRRLGPCGAGLRLARQSGSRRHGAPAVYRGSEEGRDQARRGRGRRHRELPRGSQEQRRVENLRGTCDQLS